MAHTKQTSRGKRRGKHIATFPTQGGGARGYGRG